MKYEIERKYRVHTDDWRSAADNGTPYRQGYITTTGSATVRIRLAGDKAFVTIKGKPNAQAPLSRTEYEYEIPYAEGTEMLDTLCAPEQIEKTRYKVPHKGHIWEIDVFHGANEGLVLAEIELNSENEPFEPPNWLGEDVSLDPRYKNTALAVHPRPDRL